MYSSPSLSFGNYPRIASTQHDRSLTRTPAPRVPLLLFIEFVFLKYILYLRYLSIFCSITVQKEKVKEFLHDNPPAIDIDGVLTNIPSEIESKINPTADSFLDPAIAVADIDTFYVDEGQTVNFI